MTVVTVRYRTGTQQVLSRYRYHEILVSENWSSSDPDPNGSGSTTLARRDLGSNLVELAVLLLNLLAHVHRHVLQVAQHPTHRLHHQYSQSARAHR